MTQPYVSASGTKWVISALVAVLLLTVSFGWATIAQQRAQTANLSANNRELKHALDKMQLDLDALSRRQIPTVEAVTDKDKPTISLATPASKTIQIRRTAPAAKPPAARRDPRVDQLQSKLAGQEKELASTRNQLDETRRELEARLGSSHDELSGSIARTHDELQELKLRGERNFYEFDLTKNKGFTRVGPLGLSLRKADTKRKSYQVKLRLDDQELEKKNVNLFEPILLSAPDSSQPLQLVVNDISKDRIRGYVSELKVKQPAVAQSRSQEPALQSRE